MSLVFSVAVEAADTPRLALWITAPIGKTSANQCRLTNNESTSKLPRSQPTFTELDVIGWNADTAHWSLDPVRFSSANSIRQVQDHCFILAIDGKRISSGVVLSSNSERLVHFPTISVYDNNKDVDLRLTSSFHDHAMQPIHSDALNAVLGQSITATGKPP